MTENLRTRRQVAIGLGLGIATAPLALLLAAEPPKVTEPVSDDVEQRPAKDADDVAKNAWPPAPPREKVVGMWLLANGGMERYLMIWLKEDGTFVRGVVHHPEGEADEIRLEGEVVHDSPWKIRQVPRGGYSLVMGEAKKQPDGSTVSTAQALSLVYLDRDTLTIERGFAGALINAGSVYQRASAEAARSIANLIEK